MSTNETTKREGTYSANTDSLLRVWSVVSADGTYTVETRDHLGWASYGPGATMVDGATAEVPLRESQRPRVCEAVAAKHWDDTPEDTHRRALELLAMHNRWTTIDEDSGEVRAAITATLVRSRPHP